METYKDGRGYPTRRYKSKKGAEYELIEVKPGSKRKRSSSASKKPKSAAASKSSPASKPRSITPARKKRSRSTTQASQKRRAMTKGIKRARKSIRKRKPGQMALL